jgi:hypothetical protein
MNRPADATLWERVRIRPRFERDEVVLGFVAALALHGIFAALLIVKVKDPAPILEETAVTKPVIGATMMKLGKPIDPKKLPDRLIPQARTAPQNRASASRDSPTASADNTDPNANANRRDAGAPVPNAKDDDLLNLAAKSDPFAEKTHARPEVGDPSGTREGTATDPSQVQAGDAYAAKLGQFFRDHWQIPTVITEAQASRLCVSYAVDVASSMQITHVGLGSLTDDPAATGRISKSSGNALFDESARTMLEKLLTDRTRLPDPPPEVAPLYRGRRVVLVLSGDLHGDASRCR